MRENIKQALFWLTMALSARLLPHPPNLSPYASLVMLMGCQLSRRSAILLTFASLMISDVVFALFLHEPVFGSWSLFTYSGFLLIAFASSHYLDARRSFRRIAGFSLSAVLLYWLWTNFGTWLATPLYPHTTAGLMACFVAGLPFLHMSLLAALIFEPLFFALMIYMERKWIYQPR